MVNKFLQLFPIVFLIVISSLQLQGQDFKHQSPEVPYRSIENPHYWKNSKPYEGYWQQDVHYTIKATLDDEKHVVDADYYRLVYYNNSPFVLNELFFHLHNNAFTPGSYYHALNLANDIKVTFGPNEKAGLGTVCDSLRVNGEAVKSEVDNTIMKVILNTPLKSGDSLVVTMKFKTYFDPAGSLRRRMKVFESHGYKHYDGVHWYPAVTVYDHKFGWATDQHLDKEFYSNFGTFDVELTFPNDYILEATGTLQNREEVLPDTLRAKIDLSNFKNKKLNEPPSVIIPRISGATKTWKYHAKNVHNFAFTADPMYRIGELEWNGIKIVTIAQEPNAAGWQMSGWFTANVIRIYSRDFTMYDWPKIVVADARDGMEYPMLTLDGGTYPGHQSLLAHEVGHMWFYGMVANNETYRAFLDEGFTQFLTVWSMDRIVGERRARIGKNNYITRHLDSSVTRFESLYYPYINHVVENYDERINRHSSDFHGAIRHGGNYGLVYYKAGTMLYNLRYVLGDELFLKAMQHYVRKWKFCHPYPEDFRQAIIESTQADLNWFFDQWMESTKYIDYAVTDVERTANPEEYRITFRRKGEMQMPVDFTVTTETGAKYNYHIPNTWFVKKTEATVLSKWYGWGILVPEYVATVKIPGRIQSVEIDPERYLADIDLTNNVIGDGGIRELQFDHKVPNMQQWTKQRNFWRPALWYNAFDGAQVGINVKGSYFGKYNYNSTLWFNTGLGQQDFESRSGLKHQYVGFEANYRRNLARMWKGLAFTSNAFYNVGLTNLIAGFEKTIREPDQRTAEYSRFFFNFRYLITNENFHMYRLYPNNWGRFEGDNTPGLVNGMINLGYFRYYTYQRGNGDFTISGRVPSFRSDYNYSFLNLNSVNRFNISSFEIKTRVFGQLGIGNMPLESSLYLAGASPETYIDNRFTQARGVVPNQWLGYGIDANHFHMGGGLNLRGYSGYLVPEVASYNGQDTVFFAHYGNSGASFNAEIDFDKFIKIPAKGITRNLHFDTYLFADIGILNYRRGNEYNWGSLRMDAGIGTALTIKFSPYDIKPITIRFDMPLFLNTPPAVSDYLAVRYVVGINRAF
ncbi:MAG: M1 family aminopeptidase [Cytophagaceae bacterium]